jgi:crotonobetainyl-CoA:carnitine CoA-transferase CaiB-like acyl-CoA transferase
MFCLKLNLDAIVNHQMQSDQQELIDIVSTRIRSKSQQEWLEFFGSEDICVTPIKEFADVIQDPQILHREMFLNIDYSSGALKQMKTPFVEKTTATDRAPVLGEHNVETLTSLGYSAEEIAAFKEEDVL